MCGKVKENNALAVRQKPKLYDSLMQKKKRTEMSWIMTNVATLIPLFN